MLKFAKVFVVVTAFIITLYILAYLVNSVFTHNARHGCYVLWQAEHKLFQSATWSISVNDNTICHTMIDKSVTDALLSLEQITLIIAMEPRQFGALHCGAHSRTGSTHRKLNIYACTLVDNSFPIMYPQLIQNKKGYLPS